LIEYHDSRGGESPQQRSFWPWLFAEAGWFVLCAVGGAAFVIGVGFALGIGLGFWSLFFALLTTVALAMRARILQRSRAMMAVNYLEQAVRLNLPLPPMLAAAQATERGPMRRRLGHLRMEIEAGSPIATALRRASPGAPPRVIGLISAGERLGRLPQALHRTATTERHILRDRRRSLQSIMLRWYPMLIAVGVLPVFSMIMVFVMPKFQRIFRDFGLQLPGVTLWLLNVWDVMAWPLFIVAALGMALACARMFADLFPLRRPPRRRFGFLDRFTWSVPPWRGILRNRALGDVCHVIADALNAGQPADRAILDAGEISPNVFFRRQMQEWARYVGEGVPLADAAQRAAMPAIFSGMLRTARDSAGAAEVFAFLARYYDSRHSKAAALLEGAAIPAMVLVMAFFVVTLALGLFLPLVKLMEHLSSSRWVM
jgi:type IV pilus assembly protein PilC